MDAKQRASFINSIGTQPGTAPKPETATVSSAEEESGMASPTPFAAVGETAPLTSLSDAAPKAAHVSQSAPASAFAAVEDRPATAVSAAVQAEEEENAFAQGLPDWDLVPPQLAVRRRRSV